MANEVKIDVLFAIEEANKRLDRLDGNIAKLSKNSQNFFGKMNAAWSSFVGNLGAQAVTKAFSLASQAAQKFFDVFIIGGIAAASEAEDAINALNVALQATGKFTPEASQELQNYAAQLQATTRFSDDLILRSQAVLQGMANLDTNGLKRATLGAVNLAAGMKMELEPAMEIIGKAANGNTTALQKMGIAVNKGATNAETFANVLEVLEKKFGGAAAGQVRTYAGALAQAANAFNDLQEQTGALIVRNPVVIKLLNEAASAFRDLSQWVEKNQEKILAFVNEGIVFMVKGIGYALIALDYVSRAMTVLTTNVDIMKNSIIAVGLAFTGDFSKAKDVLASGIERIKESWTALNESGVMAEAGNQILTYGDKLDQFSRDHKHLTTQIPQDTQKMVEKEKDAIEQLTEFYGAANENRVANLKDSLGTIATLMQTSTGLLFDIGKGAAIAQATIDGIAAVQKALASAPPPFNFAIAALVGVASAANIAKIASQQPPKFAEGGIVPGSSTQGDRISARLNSREMVLTLDDQKALLSMIRGGGEGGGGDVTNNIYVGSVDSEERVAQLTREISKVSRNRNIPLRGRFA
jgi:hypothetical protein